MRPPLGRIAAVIEDFGPNRLQLADNGAVVLFARVDPLIENLLYAGGVQVRLDLIGEVLAVRALVVHERDFLVPVPVRHPRADHFALVVVSRVEPHDRRPALGESVVSEP
jgi:hydrogenase maturation factor